MIDFSIAGLRAAYRGGLSPEATVAEAYRRIAEANDPGIFIALAPEAESLARARALGPWDPTRPLWGVPFAVKDNIDLAGLPTTAACPDYAYRPAASARAVERLIAAGAIPLGKTNLDQFATGLVGTRTPHPVPRNALDPLLIPGGSSSGSAVAVARGLVTFALGTDTAGSGRVPAALNGIVGLKPSLGLVSTHGVVPACRTLDCVSVFARSVADAWAPLESMAGFDSADPYSRRRQPPTQAGLPPNLRLGVPSRAQREFFGDARAEAAYERHLAALTPFAVPVEIDMAPFFAAAKLLYEGPWVAERYAAFGAFIAAHPQSAHPVTREIVGSAARHSAVDAFSAMYRLAELRRATEATWIGVDALCLPTTPTLYTLEEVAAEPFATNARLGTYTNFVNLLDLCALAVPGSSRSDGRPAGLTFVAPSGRDGLLSALGRRFLDEPAAVAPPQGDIVVAVVGAHMSGLPLNGDLLALGASFLSEGTTAPDYRLHALPGGPPRRPGLLRVADGEGGPIALELWSLPPAAFGAFVATVPAPLSIGSIRLTDGAQPKGFLVEAQGVEGAQDITGYGGWRAWLAAANR